jgi:hypothetical protein
MPFLIDCTYSSTSNTNYGHKFVEPYCRFSTGEDPGHQQRDRLRPRSLTALLGLAPREDIKCLLLPRQDSGPTLPIERILVIILSRPAGIVAFGMTCKA